MNHQQTCQHNQGGISIEHIVTHVELILAQRGMMWCGTSRRSCRARSQYTPRQWCGGGDKDESMWVFMSVQSPRARGGGLPRVHCTLHPAQPAPKHAHNRHTRAVNFQSHLQNYVIDQCAVGTQLNQSNLLLLQCLVKAGGLDKQARTRQLLIVATNAKQASRATHNLPRHN